MNKELFSFLFVFLFLFVGAFYYTNTIQDPLISTLNIIKKSYNDSLEYINNSIDKHLFQAQTIEELKKELLVYEKNHLEMRQLAENLNDLYLENNSSLKTQPDVELVRAISYSDFGDFNKIWIDFKDYNASKIYGLVYKELVAGIVVSKNRKPLALLNKDIKSSYSVFVGPDFAPGIAHGNNAKNMVVEFVPTWYNIKVGDEVITSGLDNIFFKGLKVGKVVSITSSQGYQDVVVEPYYTQANPDYFHIIKRLR